MQGQARIIWNAVTNASGDVDYSGLPDIIVARYLPVTQSLSARNETSEAVIFVDHNICHVKAISADRRSVVGQKHGHVN